MWSKEVRCAWEPSHHTQWKVLHQTKVLNRDMAIQIENENAHNTLSPRRLVWMSDTSTQIELIDVCHY